MKELKGKNEVELFSRWYDGEDELVKVDFMPRMQINDDEAYLIRTTLLKNNSSQGETIVFCLIYHLMM